MGCCESQKVLPTVLAPFKLVIIKVSDLPETDFSLSKDNRKPEPYVRIRFTEIETGKELKDLARKTKALVDADEANFFELFNFQNQVPHYGIRLHLEVLDKDFFTRDDFIGAHVLTLGRKDEEGEWKPTIDFNDYTAEAPLLSKVKTPDGDVGEATAAGAVQNGFIKFRITTTDNVTVKVD